MNGFPSGKAPYTVPKSQCEVVCDHKLEDGYDIQSKTGVCGQIIDRLQVDSFDNSDQIKIFIKDVVEHAGGRDKWVPGWVVIIGKYHPTGFGIV